MAGLAIMLAERSFDSFFGGGQVLQDPGLLDQDGAARDRGHFSFHRAPQSHAGRDLPALRIVARRTVACLSLALWIGVALAGKGIAIFQPT